MHRIRVMIVEDSLTVREFLRHVIGDDPRLEVAAAVESGEEALRVLHRVSPDVISMDVRLPGMNGLEATQRIMRDKPTPIVVVSASVESDDLSISMNALRAGALSVVEKPVGSAHRDYELMRDKLCTQLVLMSQVKTVRQRMSRSLDMPGAPRQTIVPRAHAAMNHAGPYRLVGIVASTGGPAALQTLLCSLDAKFPLPIVIVQHIASGFLDGFASWLNAVCPLKVSIARDGEAPQPGCVYLPPADRHLKIEGGRLIADAGSEVSSQRPSGTVLFRSMAKNVGSGTLAVLLTGMGDDGAIGMKEVRDAGGYTIAEDESTAVVYGMPALAVRLGGACESLPLHEIGPRLRELAPATKGVA